MKYSIAISFLLVSILSFGQNTPIATSNQSTTEKVKRTDSVTFCSRTFAIPRECTDYERSDELEANCCSANIGSNSGDFACYNGTTLFWDYTLTEERARDIFESIPPQTKRQMKSFKSKRITCYLLGKKVKGLKATYTMISGEEGSSIFAYGTINSQPIYIELVSFTEFKSNEDIPKGIRQIVTLTK